MAIILKKNFYAKNTLDVASAMLGCCLVRKIGNKIIRGKITEVEAYVGEDDLACHASRGRTSRAETMYGEAGRAYVYMIYGVYHCLNVVTEKKNFPAAVLIRGIEIDGIDRQKTDGPGKLCRFLEIDRKLNSWDLTMRERLWIERGEKIPEEKIRKSKRIGVDYAKHCKHYMWRFLL